MTRTADLQADIGEVLLSEEAIAARVAELGRQIAADYAGRNLTLVTVLKGSLPFMADLMRQIPLPLRIDLMEVSSYGGTATESSGLVRIMKDLSASIADEDVLLVEDIIDTGPDAELPRALPARQEPGLAPDLHAARQARPAPRRDPRRLHRASRSRTSSSSATAWTTASATGTCASWACCAPRSTRRPNDALAAPWAAAAGWRCSAPSS